MRDFLNEDELALLKETCSSGQVEAAEFLSLKEVKEPTHRSFQFGIINALKECYKCKSLSEISNIADESNFEMSSLTGNIFDQSQQEFLSFLYGRYQQAKFIFNRLIALRFVLDTLDPGFIYFIPKEHIVFIKMWRESYFNSKNLYPVL